MFTPRLIFTSLHLPITGGAMHLSVYGLPLHVALRGSSPAVSHGGRPLSVRGRRASRTGLACWRCVFVRSGPSSLWFVVVVAGSVFTMASQAVFLRPTAGESFIVPFAFFFIPRHFLYYPLFFILSFLSTCFFFFLRIFSSRPKTIF